jgi:hypothetical protein
MATPTYQHFDFSMPRINATRQNNIDAIAGNLTAEQLDRALWGAAGWTQESALDGQGRLETSLYKFKDGVTWQRVTFSYYTAGTGEGQIKSALREYSADAGATWERIGEHGWTYNAQGNMNLLTTWSD